MNTVRTDITSDICTKHIYSTIDEIKSDVAEVMKSGPMDDDKTAEILTKAGQTIDQLISITFKIEDLYGER